MIWLRIFLTPLPCCGLHGPRCTASLTEHVESFENYFAHIVSSVFLLSTCSALSSHRHIRSLSSTVLITMLAIPSSRSTGTGQQKSLRKHKRASNLKANLIFFDSAKTPPEKPPSLDAYGSTFTLSLLQSNNTRSAPSTNRRSLFVDLGLPTLFVILPLTLLAATLFGLVVYGWQNIGQQSLFANETVFLPAKSGFILVNISNSWLLSLASVSSTVAGLMAPSVMMIQMYLNAQAMQDSSVAAQNALGTTRNLPTPYQISLILGLSSGNPERLWRFEKYSRATANEVPPMMRRTALILKLCLLLSLAMFVADQCLHYTTTTVQIDQATAMETVSSFGRGLTQECLSMSREQNYWEPCSVDFNFNTFQRETAQNQMFFLQQGTSNVSNIEVVDAVRQPGADMAMLFAADVESNLDYRTSTIGVSAQCVPISSKCAMMKSGATGSYTSFNCSENFWGILNKDPASSTNISFVDPDLPPLAFKWSKNLQ